jgi:hypothetical protein
LDAHILSAPPASYAGRVGTQTWTNTQTAEVAFRRKLHHSGWRHSACRNFVARIGLAAHSFTSWHAMAADRASSRPDVARSLVPKPPRIGAVGWKLGRGQHDEAPIHDPPRDSGAKGWKQSGTPIEALSGYGEPSQGRGAGCSPCCDFPISRPAAPAGEIQWSAARRAD